MTGGETSSRRKPDSGTTMRGRERDGSGKRAIAHLPLDILCKPDRREIIINEDDSRASVYVCTVKSVRYLYTCSLALV